MLLIEFASEEFEKLFLSLELVVTSLHLGDESSLWQMRVHHVVHLAEAAFVYLLFELEAVI